MNKLVFWITILTFSAKAQVNGKFEADSSGSGNGGSSIEARVVSAETMIKSNILKIRKFFKENEKAQKEFQEIDFKEFFEIIGQLLEGDSISIIPNGDLRNQSADRESLLDKYNIKRTALNFPSKTDIWYDLEEVEKLESQPKVLFVLNMHEILGLLGIEENNPRNTDLYMNYSSSSKITKFITKVDSFDLEYKENSMILNSYRSIVRAFFDIESKGTFIGARIFGGKCISEDSGYLGNIAYSLTFFNERPVINALVNYQEDSNFFLDMGKTDTYIEFAEKNGSYGESTSLYQYRKPVRVERAYIAFIQTKKEEMGFFKVKNKFSFKVVSIEGKETLIGFGETQGKKYACWGEEKL